MDQAERLRQIINNIKIKQGIVSKENPNYLKKSATKIITITSGKGGVGKTNITVNLAIALGELGKKVIILDADLGLSNIEVLLGIAPQYTLGDIIYNNKSIFDVITTGPNNIRFISGGSGADVLVKLNKEVLDRFILNIGMLDKIADIILIDTGAGLSDSVTSFIMAADEVILVTTPEPTSLTDAYALIKTVITKDRNKKINLIVNKAEDEREAKDIINKISLVVNRFLGVKLNPLGFILQDQAVVKSVKQQNPFYMKYPNSDATKSIKDISKKIVENDEQGFSEGGFGIKVFFNKLIGFMRG
ncbi:MAG TPA: MinD/ParA family protein [Clostridiaceae bacterium]|nr:MinD/ParA family protein [Clostridiaceae bacterium]